MSGTRSAAESTLWGRAWFSEASVVRLGMFRILVMVAAFDAVWRYRPLVERGVTQDPSSTGAIPWRPLFFLELTGQGPPDATVAHALLAVLVVGIVLGFVGLFGRVVCPVVAVLFTEWAAIHYSFGKPHHDSIQLTFALWALALAPSTARLSLDSTLARLRRARSSGDPTIAPARAPWAGLPIHATRVAFALGYGFAGWTKIARSGLDWANGYTLQGIMLEYRAEWSEPLARHAAVCQVLQIGLLFVQATFPLVLVFPRLAWFYVPAGVSFHIVAMKTMSTGLFASAWIPLIAAFVEWHRLLPWLRRQRRDHPALLGLALAAASLPAFSVARTYMQHKPEVVWLLIAGGAAVLLGSVARTERMTVDLPARTRATRRAAALLAAFSWTGRRRVRLRTGDREEIERNSRDPAGR